MLVQQKWNVLRKWKKKFCHGSNSWSGWEKLYVAPFLLLCSPFWCPSSFSASESDGGTLPQTEGKKDYGESSVFGDLHQEEYDGDSDGDGFFLLILWSSWDNLSHFTAYTTPWILCTGLQFRVISEFTSCVLCVLPVHFLFVLHKTNFTQIPRLYSFKKQLLIVGD